LPEEKEVVASDNTVLRKGGGNQLVLSIRKGLANMGAIQKMRGKLLTMDLIRENGAYKIVVELNAKDET